MIRLQVLFKGRVQGVGFRYTVHRISHDFDAHGFVRNLPNGHVELVVEGAKPELERFVKEIRAAMDSNIQHVDVHTLTSTGEFSGFEIRH